MLVWSFIRIRRLFPSYNAMCDALRAQGQPVPTLPNIAMWSSRNAIPGRWTAPLVAVLQHMNVELSSVMVENHVANAERRADNIARANARSKRKQANENTPGIPVTPEADAIHDDIFGTSVEGGASAPNPQLALDLFQ
jgi:hypothetical protein